MEVVLRSTDGHDSLYERQLRLTLKGSVKIGRASKTGSRNVQPAENNAFIDSPVISRDHAVLTMKNDGCGNPAIFLTDIGSMHGTYVNREKVEPNVPHPLSQGAVVEFGANVYRNSETFHSRRYEVSISPLRTSPSRSVISSTFVVPDGESSDEESYGSSRMDESDVESESSAPEVLLIRKSESIARDSVQESNQGIDSSISRNVVARIASNVLVSSSSKAEEPEVFEGALESDPEVQDSVSTSFSLSDEDRDLSETADIGYHHGKSVPSVGQSLRPSPSPAPSSNSLREIEEAVDSNLSAPPRNTTTEIPHAKTGDHSQAFKSQFMQPTEHDQLYIMGEDGLMPTTTVSRSVDADHSISPIDAGQGSERRTRLPQIMSLDRILGSDSKNSLLQPNPYVPHFTRLPFGTRADAVTVESMLNVTSGLVPEQGPSHRDWSGISTEFNNEMPVSLIPPPKEQLSNDALDQHWSSVPLESLVDDPTLNDGQYRQGPFAPNYSTSNIFTPNSSVPAFDLPEMHRTILHWYSPPTDGTVKEPEKSKKSISISDIVDKHPAPLPSVAGKKRKASVLEELNSSEETFRRTSLEPTEKTKTTAVTATSGKPESVQSRSENPNSLQSSSSAAEKLERPPKRKKLHAGSAILGAFMGGLGVFAALAFLPESLFE